MELEENEEAYLDTVNKPFFADDAPISALTPEALLDAFARIFERQRGEALRRDLYLWGPRYEAQRRGEARSQCGQP